MKAMILAAGLGTRLKPFTEQHPKALLPINGKSLLQRNIIYLQQAGITDVVVNVHHFASQIIDTINHNNGWGSHITISDETNEVLETGGGLLKAAPLLKEGNEAFVLMNADILTDMDLQAMIAQHQQSQALATLAVTNRTSSRNLLFDENHYLCGWRNNNTGEQKGKSGQAKAFSGIHIIEPNIFDVITETGKFSMIDVYMRLCTTQKINAYDHSHTHLIDVGKPESIAIAESLFS